MELTLLIILIVIILMILLFIIAIRVKLVFNSDKSYINMTLLWISPLIKAFVTIKDSKPIISLYIFNKMIFKRAIKKVENANSGMKLVQLTNPKDIQVNVQYGFKDPFITGITCGVINIASQFINIDSINQSPNFMTENDYIYLDANAKVNLGSTLFRFLSQKMGIERTKIQ